MRLAALFTVLVLSTSLGVARACADSPLHLNEILPGPATDWDGSGAFSSRDDEWVELVNTSSAPLDLSGFYLTDGDSIPRYAFTGSLAAGARMVVYGKNAWDWERANGQPAFGLSLGNTGDSVLLWRIVGSDSTVVDAYTYRSHEAAADRAIGRSPDGSGDWALFDGMNPYSGATLPVGTGCMPSPNATNICGSTPVQVTSWGRVKTLFR